MYFCKTSTRNPLKYHGSGKYWKQHLKVHGRNIETLWYQQFTDKDDLVEFALFFSDFHDIVKAKNVTGGKIWANEIPEDGLQGGQNRGVPGPLKGIKQPRVTAALTGRKRPKHSMLMVGRKQSENHIKNRADSMRGKPKAKEHCAAISDAKKGKPNPKLSDALKGRPNKNKGKPQKTYSCEHCGIETTGGNLKRWHGENCKHKGNNNG
jgi:hypothetical protein